MSSERKGHGSSKVHGHGPKPGRSGDPTNRKQGKITTGLPRLTKPKQGEHAEERTKRSSVVSLTDKQETAVITSNDEIVHVAVEIPDDDNTTTNEKEKEKEEENEQNKNQNGWYNADYSRSRTEYKRCNITPENFNVKEFNTNITEFTQTLDDPRYSEIDAEYPVQKLVSVVSLVSKSLNSYITHSSDTQKQLTDLKDCMRKIKENLHFSVTRQALNMGADEDNQTEEERELFVKLTKLNAELAQASADVTEAIRLATETESTAVRANFTAERAKAEAVRMKEEAEKKEKAEQRRKEEEKRRKEEERRIKEETERRIEEEKRRIEEEWKRKEATHAGKAGLSYENWQPVEYNYTNENGESEITCIARGQPGSFDKHHVICRVSKEKEALVTYQPNEELISNVIDLSPANGDGMLKSPLFVAIPHILSRSGAQSREAVVKALSEGEWKDLPTKDITFDNHKDTKFAQAEVRHLTTLIIVSRLKRDYVTLSPNKSQKVSSSFDQRITLTVQKDTFVKPEHLLLQVHPVDSGTFQEFRNRQTNGKKLLTCSPVIYTQWESTSFGKPIEVTVSCPPNPAKAKKMALARKIKEEKMMNPAKKPVPVEEPKKETDNAKKRMQEFLEEENPPAKITKWYMGEYGHTDDDETDKLHFVYMLGDKWMLDTEMIIKQIKIDVLQFCLDFPVERFIILRTRTTLESDDVATVAAALSEFLGKRFVEAVIRQRSDNPCEVALQVIPVSRLDAVVKQLAQKGFESGPAPSHVICLQEGDLVEVGFAGNIECTDDVPEQLIYKSNIPTLTYFTVKEENKFRQKEQDVYSGIIHLTRRYLATPQKVKKLLGQNTVQNEDVPQQPVKEWKSEKLCTIQINIPKYHNEPVTEPIKAPVAITFTNEPVDCGLLKDLSVSLGDEWKRVAHYLGVHRARVQAIIRNVSVGERSDIDAKYDMLLTWLKSAAKALDKVSTLSSALKFSGRHDLAEEVQDRYREFHEYRRRHMTAAN